MVSNEAMKLESVEKITAMSGADRLTHYREYLVASREKARKVHDAGGAGDAVCKMLSDSFDKLLVRIYGVALLQFPEMEKIALVANGGYGRAQLFPGSDIDLLFLLPRSSSTLSKGMKEAIDQVLYTLWDLNLKLGHAVRSSNENVAEGKQDPITRTTLLDSRLIVGNRKLFKNFMVKFRKEAVKNDKANFFKERSADLKTRYKKFYETIYLQEPNVKESPGGLRDWHNLLWIADAVTGERDLSFLEEEGMMSEVAVEQVQESVDFLMRVRNEIHFRTRKGTDLLSLQLQGEVAEAFEYEGDDILIKIESFMKDYYMHTRNLRNRVRGTFDMLNIEMEAFKEQSLSSWLPWVNHKVVEEEFDGFVSRDGLLYSLNDEVFTQDPARLLRAFWHCQNYSLRLAPSLRKLIKLNLDLVDDAYRCSEETAETIENIFSMRGRVGLTLRAMHRVGLLGKVIPEFGSLDCLVQHEFFHRYTADEHTLRCIEFLDKVANDSSESMKLYHELFMKIEDPYAMYMALLLHDTGRSLNTDDHVDGSYEMTKAVCKRLKIEGERQKLIMFLVDHHLTLFNVGTKKDIDDPEVISETCKMMKTADRTAALLVFTYCDSSGTNPDGWSGWKALAICTLFKRVYNALRRSPEEAREYLETLLSEQSKKVKELLPQQYWEAADEHFEDMPVAYFRYRDAESVSLHVRAIWQYQNRRERRPDTPFEAAFQWYEHRTLSYSEVSIVAMEQPNLLATICCAMATHNINILAANVHTRNDGLVLDLFKVCNEEQKAVTDDILQMEIVATLYELNEGKSYESENYITQVRNVKKYQPMLVVIPQIEILNDEHELYTSIEVQATDRIGLLHDLMRLFGRMKLTTKGARITTERNTAIDSFLVVNEHGEKLSDEMISELKEQILDVAHSE